MIVSGDAASGGVVVGVGAGADGTAAGGVAADGTADGGVEADGTVARDEKSTLLNDSSCGGGFPVAPAADSVTFVVLVLVFARVCSVENPLMSNPAGGGGGGALMAPEEDIIGTPPKHAS